MNKIAIVIPSRIGSTRLPNKAIANINGKTMILRVIEQCLKSNLCKPQDVMVATDNQQIASESLKAGVQPIITDSNIQTGTDRIYQALLQTNNLNKYDIFVNVQGDVPNIDPSIIIKTVNALQNIPSADIATACCICKPEDYNKPSVVKAVLSFKNELASSHNLNTIDEFDKIANAIYFSRNAVPYSKTNNHIIYEHIGIYAYRTKSLQHFVNLKQGDIEILESLEQLRAIENSMKIISVLSQNKPISVDTPEDLEAARSSII